MYRCLSANRLHFAPALSCQVASAVRELGSIGEGGGESLSEFAVDGRVCVGVWLGGEGRSLKVGRGLSTVPDVWSPDPEDGRLGMGLTTPPPMVVNCGRGATYS